MIDPYQLHDYFMLRGALLRYQQLPWSLGDEQHVTLEQDAAREEQLVMRALASPIAAEICTEAEALRQAVERFIQGLEGFGDAAQLLSMAGLQRETLAAVMENEMRAASVLEQVTAAAAPTEAEVYQWYENNPQKFEVPERREVFQILITINDNFPENRRDEAERRISLLAWQAHTAPETFGTLAKSHSECPSAVEEGRLGVVPPGHLYAELDRELFTLKRGAISRVIESPLGFHLLRCGAIEPSRRLGWEEVKESLTRRLTEARRKRFLHNWLAGSVN